MVGWLVAWTAWPPHHMPGFCKCVCVRLHCLWAIHANCVCKIWIHGHDVSSSCVKGTGLCCSQNNSQLTRLGQNQTNEQNEARRPHLHSSSCLLLKGTNPRMSLSNLHNACKIKLLDIDGNWTRQNKLVGHWWGACLRLALPCLHIPSILRCDRPLCLLPPPFVDLCKHEGDMTP